MILKDIPLSLHLALWVNIDVYKINLLIGVRWPPFQYTPLHEFNMTPEVQCKQTFHCHLSVILWKETAMKYGRAYWNWKVNWLFNVTINDSLVIYVTAHRSCTGGLKQLDLRSDSQCHRHFVWFFNVSVQAPTRDRPFYTVIPESWILIQSFVSTAKWRSQQGWIYHNPNASLLNASENRVYNSRWNTFLKTNLKDKYNPVKSVSFSRTRSWLQFLTACFSFWCLATTHQNTDSLGDKKLTATKSKQLYLVLRSLP